MEARQVASTANGEGPYTSPTTGAQRWESMMAELDMSWVTEQVVVEAESYVETRDFEGFTL